ncbi:MAG TPA: SMC-Scp complex subunit ScpB [Actinomycetaceae bacterium]|nr:SMC-Scp complex subunit ScpB [Actinomycetaceae bacterium]
MSEATEPAADALFPEPQSGASDAYDPVPDDALPERQLAAIEAILMVIDEPVPAANLAESLGLPTGQVLELLEDLAADYRGEHGSRARGFELRELAGGWRIYSRPEHADAVGRFIISGQTARLTQAALETLAIVAYRQPVSRGGISAIRGVNVDSVVRTLHTRRLIEEVGTDERSGAVLYGTTLEFLERLGLASLEDLPPLAPYLPDLEQLDGVEGELR